MPELPVKELDELTRLRIELRAAKDIRTRKPLFRKAEFSPWLLGPFSQDRTRVLKPMLNNARIVAQEGWFTVHRYSAKALRYVPLNVNTKLHDHLTCFEFPGSLRKPIMQKLSRLGVNHQTVYADVYGLCRHVSWVYGF